MSFSWDDYLIFARKLAEDSSEAAQRSAISRAYYAVFHLAQDRALSNGYERSFADSAHKLIWEFYTNSPDLECRELGVLGTRLKDKRTKSDYDNPYRGRLTEEAADAVSKAGAFATRLAQVPERLPSKNSARSRGH